MSLYKFSWVVLHCWVVAILLFKAHGDGSGISVSFLKAPNSTTSLNWATFLFDVSVDGNKVAVNGSNPCNRSSITCKLDNGITTDCEGKEVSYSGLQDGNHTFEVCSTASPGVHCSTYNWIVDTVPPTAYITSPSSVTNALNVSVNISFTEPCTREDGKQGFRCSTLGACNLLVYGDGQVIPSSLVTLVPTRKYTLLVALSSKVTNGNVILEMDNNFCSDAAGNKFNKSENSAFKISFDRSGLFVNLSSSVPEKLLQLDSGNMSLLATNNQEDLKLYLNFSQPVPISYTDVLNSLSTTKGKLFPISGDNLGDQRYGFQVVDIPDSYAVINISFNSESISSKLGNPVSPIEPISFEYDSRRPQVSLITESRRTTQDSIPIWIHFSKPVLGFNESCISIPGGHLLRSSFKEINRTTYFMKIQADDDYVSVNVPENVTEDIYGNKNQAEALNVTHDSEPALSRVTSTFVTSTFGITCLAQGMLTVSSASLVFSGAIQGSSSLMSDPASSLFLSLGHIQLVALTRWMPVKLPNNYYDYAKALEWSIPYFNLPWEKKHVPPVNGSSKFNEQAKEVNLDKAANMVQRHRQSGRQLSAKGSSIVSEAVKIGRSEYLESEEEDGWRDFKRSMFWLAVIGGSLILLHGLIILFIKIRWPHVRRDYGVLTFPRFEIFCIILALPCICKASTSLIAGGEPSGVAVGTLLLGLVFLILLCFFLFLLFGVTLGMLLLYDEDYYEEGQEQRKWYQPIIRVIGPDLRSEWFWKNQSVQQQSNQLYVTILGPLFEDLRGVRKYMLRQSNPQTIGDSEATGGNPYQPGGRITPSNDEIKNVEEQSGKPHKNGDGIVASDDKTGDARARDDIIASDDKTEDARGGDQILAYDDEPEDARGGNPQNKYGDGMIRKDVSFREKLFSIPRTYYTLLETVRQVILAILGVAISDEESSKPSIITLCLTAFLLLFLVFLRPFVSKRGLVVESISVVCEVVLLTLTLILLVVTDVKTKDIIGACMLILPFVGYVLGMLNQSYGLYSQIKDLDQQENLDQSDKSFIRGLKKAFSGFLDFFLLQKLMEKENLEGRIPPGKAGNGDTGSSADRNRSSSTIDKPGIKQPTETTKSFSGSSKQATVAPNYP